MKTVGILISSYFLLCTGIAQAGLIISSGDDSSKYFDCSTPPNVDSSYRIRAIEPKGNLLATKMYYEFKDKVTELEAIFTETRPEGKSLILTFANSGRYSLTIDATALERDVPPVFVSGWYRTFNDQKEIISQELLVCQYFDGSI